MTIHSIVENSIKGWKGYQRIYPLHHYDSLAFLVMKTVSIYLSIY